MRLIDADALKAWLKTIPLKDLSDGKGLCRVIMEHDFAKAIKNMPTECIVDAVEVVHGSWNENADCSICGMPAPTDDRIDFINIAELNYCPYCGAKMDEVADEET